LEEEAKRAKKSKKAKREILEKPELFLPFLFLFTLFASSSKSESHDPLIMF
jgi:hypothetical protein